MLPLATAIVIVFLLGSANQVISAFLNDRHRGRFRSDELYTRNHVRRDDEKWIFVNSIAVG